MLRARGQKYERGTQLIAGYSEVLDVNPSMQNDGTLTPGAGGSIIGYEYRLPRQRHMLPVRRIRMLPSAENPDGRPYQDILLTLRSYDGRFLLHYFPAFRLFIPNNVTVPLMFDKGFFPDPQQSFITWMVAGVTEHARIEFTYTGRPLT